MQAVKTIRDKIWQAHNVQLPHGLNVCIKQSWILTVQCLHNFAVPPWFWTFLPDEIMRKSGVSVKVDFAGFCRGDTGSPLGRLQSVDSARVSVHLRSLSLVAAEQLHCIGVSCASIGIGFFCHAKPTGRLL